MFHKNLFDIHKNLFDMDRGSKKRGLGQNNDALTTCKAIDFASHPEVIRLFDSRSTFPAKFDSEL